MKHIKPKIMISSCIEHSAVRFDGTMISSEVIRQLKDYVTFITVCPEMAIGLGSPRPTLRLIKTEQGIKLYSPSNEKDYTSVMQEFTHNYIQTLLKKDVDGFVFKAKSPTCGIDKIKVYQGETYSMPSQSVQNGVFADEILNTFNSLPVETERRLSNFSIREAFFIKIFTLAAFKQITSVKELQEFHRVNKYLFMSFHQHKMKKLGNIASNRYKEPFNEVYKAYKLMLDDLFASPITKRKRINTLEHIYGYFKRDISSEEKDFYFTAQKDYKNGHIPFSTTLRILQGFVIRFDQKYLFDQTIFEPYPKELITQLDSGKKI